MRATDSTGHTPTGDRLDEQPLEVSGPALLLRLREHTDAVIANLQPERPERPAELSNMLGLDRALGWRIWQIAYGEEQFPVSSYIPGRHAMTRFLRSAASQGVANEHIRALEQSHRNFDELAVIHAADRTSFDIMLAGITKHTHQAMALELRRDAFRANTHFLGVRSVSSYLMMTVWHDENTGDLVRTVIRGIHGITRMRPDQPFVLARSASSPQTTGEPVARAPLKAARLNATGVPLIEQATTADPDSVERRLVDNAGFEDALLPGPVGSNASRDVVFGEEYRSSIADAINHNNVWELVTVVRQPAEVSVMEIYADARVFACTEPGLDYWSLNSRAGHLASHTPKDSDRIPLYESVELHGHVDKLDPVPEIPRYRELREMLLEHTALDRAKLVAHRLVMRYPPCPAQCNVSLPMAAKFA